ncbi:hypothetical protein EJB05_01145, partial [Eragrostis curvula]
MATNNGEEHPGRPAAADAIDASLMVATSQGDCQKLKDLIIQKDATSMVVVMASGKQASEGKPSPATMHPLLAAAACRGDLEELKFLLNKGPLPHQEFCNQIEAYYPGYNSNRSLAAQLTATNVEESMNASSILEGVTIEGDTALHLLAANGRGDNITNCADLIYGEDKSFLCKQNYNGDTPLHCAARMGNSQMVSHFIDLARGQNIVEDLLRKENSSMETALHEAVRMGDNHIVKEFLREDPELARFPKEGPSPLYLAILQEKGDIAQTIYDESKDNVLSYTGPDGQNALHAAALRRTGCIRHECGTSGHKQMEPA